jgi:hypothetical protein
MLDNGLLKIQNQTLVDENPKWKEWCQIMQEIKEEQIQNNLEIAHVDEEAYMFKLVAYKVQFLKYMYDRLNSKLIETEGGVGVS